jgi:hypothetical protein
VLRFLALRNWRQPLLWLYFACFVVAGGAGIWAPSKSIQYAVPSWGTYVWGSFYVLGALACLAGLAFKTRAGEIVGLPLLSSACFIYGAALLLQYWLMQDGAFLAVGSLLIGQAVILADRWIAAMMLFRSIQGAAEDVP